MAQMQPKRRVEKGSGAWVDEVLSHPTTGEDLQRKSYYRPQLEQIKAGIERECQMKVKVIQEMLDLIKPSSKKKVVQKKGKK